MVLVKIGFLKQNMVLMAQFEMLFWPVLAKQPVTVVLVIIRSIH